MDRLRVLGSGPPSPFNFSGRISQAIIHVHIAVRLHSIAFLDCGLEWGLLIILCHPSSSLLPLCCFPNSAYYNFCFAFISEVLVTNRRLFSVFMWRNHIPKLNSTFPSQVLVSSDKRPSSNLTFHNVSARQGSSYCNRAHLNSQAFALRDMKIATR